MCDKSLTKAFYLLVGLQREKNKFIFNDRADICDLDSWPDEQNFVYQYLEVLWQPNPDLDKCSPFGFFYPSTSDSILSWRSRAKLSANQSTLPSVLVFDLLFRCWRKAFHREFHYVNLLNMSSKQVFNSINLSNVAFFIANQYVRIYISFGRSPSPSKVLKLFLSLK